MTTAPHWLCPDQVFDGRTLLQGRALEISAGRVQAVVDRSSLTPDCQTKAVSGVITPGYLDLQVNGGGGVQLNNAPTAITIRQMARALHRFGTVAIMPTVITDAPDVLARAVDAAIAAKDEPGILGLHIEGPHISFPRRGTHSGAFIRPLDDSSFAHVTRLRGAGLTVMLTLAPEAVQPGQVRRLVEMGVIVSIGHSDASDTAVAALLAEGASCFTHLYNAMSPMLNRAPGVTGAAINSQAYCGFICDGHHVADAMLALAIRARPVAGRMFLVSDCMATVGGADRFTLYGQQIRLVDGRLVNVEGSLAGAHVTMAESVARLIGLVGIDPAAALAMATSVPARVVGRDDLGGVIGQRVEDLLVLGRDWMPIADALARVA
ncbi:MAG: N-acetylglucosamine-6-phosphate deacetylase [Paracoccaceae bacterium]